MPPHNPDGLQAKFSVYHGCAAGLTFCYAAENEFSDEVVNRPDMVTLRRKVVATVDDSSDEASVDVTAVLKNGRRVHVFVEHAIGSLQNPMTDALLDGKSRPVGSHSGRRADQPVHQCLLGCRPSPNVSAIVALAAPKAWPYLLSIW